MDLDMNYRVFLYYRQMRIILRQQSEQFFVCIVRIMFKPSLRKSILNDNLCLSSQTQNMSFSAPVQQKRKPVPRLISHARVTSSSSLPSMMIPQEILQKSQFTNDIPFTHVFTPFTYDFEPYPNAVKEIIKSNPKAAQAGRIHEINYVIFEKYLFFWTMTSSNSQQNTLQVHKFPENIDIVEFSTIRNERIFKKQEVTVMAVTFGNRIKLYKLNQTDLKLQDLMIKYQLKASKKIQKVSFSEQNQIAFAGDSGQLSIISLNNTKDIVVKVHSPLVKKYLSKSAFDYSTLHIVRQIQIGHQFLYCLNDRISKSNYLAYLLKKAVNKVILLSEQPKYITEQTFIDIYKFTSPERKEIAFIDRISQAEIQLKIKEGYTNFWGEGLRDPFRIVSINAKGQRSFTNQKSSQKTQFQVATKQIVANVIQQVLINPMIEIITKCGYIFSLIHERTSQEKQQSSLNKERFSFVSQPMKLPQKVGEASLFQPKVISLSQQKQYRKNYVIKSLPLKNRETLILTNNCLMFKGYQQLSMIKLDDLKIGMYETTKEEQFYLSYEEFHEKYEKVTQNRQEDARQESLFGIRMQPYSREASDAQRRYYRLFNKQRRWTVFDNEGRYHIYLMDLKHIILAYLYFQCEGSTMYQRSSSRFDSSTNFLIESDLRLHSTIQKLIKVYGYCNFMKSLIQILVNNSNDQREYFYFQKELFLQVIRKQFEFELPSNFQDWSYGLGQHNKAQIIVPTEKMLQFAWITLFEHQSKPVLSSQTIYAQSANSEYSTIASQYQEAKSKLQYSAYGYALKSLFSETIDVLIYFRAKEFKLKQNDLNECKQKLVQLFGYLQNKNHKSETQEYKNYLDMKLVNLSRKKQMNPQLYGNINLNATFTTYSASLNNTQQSFLGIDEDLYTKTVSKGVSEKSNQSVERDICKSIQKIITLIDVMNIMIEKDERQGLPSFIEIVTNFKNQVRLGEFFFNEELMISDGKVEFLHPELVREVQRQLPQLQVQKKIEFLKFKISRNIALDNHLNEIDLKSLNFDKLSSIIQTSQIPELRKMFLGQKQELDFQKADYYIEFLSICLSKMMLKVKQLSVVKDQKFGSLSEEVKKHQRTSSLMTHFTVENIILAQQQLQYYQTQMAAFFEEIKHVFSKSVHSLKKISGPHYYQSEKYLERMIEILIQNFPTEEILVQALQTILREASLFEKNHFMKQLKERTLYTKNLQTPILNLPKQKEPKFTEKSTFQYLLGRNDKKLSQQRTYDTWGTESFNGRH